MIFCLGEQFNDTESNYNDNTQVMLVEAHSDFYQMNQKPDAM